MSLFPVFGHEAMSFVFRRKAMSLIPVFGREAMSFVFRQKARSFGPCATATYGGIGPLVRWINKFPDAAYIRDIGLNF